MVEDPGYIPKTGSRSQEKLVIENLLSLWKFDDHNFCITCMIRTPLRSKHCKRCKRCVAKHDQYVPLTFVVTANPAALVTVPGYIIV